MKLPRSRETTSPSPRTLLIFGACCAANTRRPPRGPLAWRGFIWSTASARLRTTTTTTTITTTTTTTGPSRRSRVTTPLTTTGRSPIWAAFPRAAAATPSPAPTRTTRPTTRILAPVCPAPAILCPQRKRRRRERRRRRKRRRRGAAGPRIPVKSARRRRTRPPSRTPAPAPAKCQCRASDSGAPASASLPACRRRPTSCTIWPPPPLQPNPLLSRMPADFPTSRVVSKRSRRRSGICRAGPPKHLRCTARPAWGVVSLR
uniref:cDNA FLJ56759 n=1 Tax=Homo sapiens TaxID=9606 RepID=B4DSF5_HUMAN|nr:unnamed protein product [Homo sapiens]